jgi:LysR family transcriptional activator of glutamate synthase operon
LTPVGKLFLKRAETILSDLERAVSEINEFLDPEHGEIRLGFPHSLGTHLIPKVVSLFRKLHPNVKFRFKQGMYPSLIQDVIKGEVDLAFISPIPDKQSKVSGDVILTEQLFAILPSSHPLAAKEKIDLIELENESFVLFGEGYSLRPIVWDACIQAGFTPQIAFESEETDTIRGLVAAGMGVSLLPEMALHQMGPLQPAKVQIASPQVSRTIGLIHRNNEKLPLVAKVFQQFLLDYFADQQKNQ